MAENSKKRAAQSQVRATAMKHAFSIEEKKKLKARVADLVIEAYDLPSTVEANPAYPTATDAAIFHECLRLFQPSDLDDLVQERNIDDRCGYALCPKPNLKMHGGGEKVWNQMGGKDFKIVNRSEMERWCSKSCANRTAFIRAQLGLEPSWLRETQNDVHFLDEVGSVDDLSEATRSLSLKDVDDGIAERLQMLSLERGEETTQDVSNQISIVERSNQENASVPPTHGEQLVEGHQPRKVRFA